jgi:hypothetical protein
VAKLGLFTIGSGQIMRTRLLGLLASTSLMLSSAAYAEPAPVASALFGPVMIGIDAVLLAANLADGVPAVVPDTDQCEYDALNGRPEPAAVLLLEPAEIASAAWDVDHQQTPSAPNPDTVVEVNAEPAASSATDHSMEPAEATGSILDPVTRLLEVGPDYGPDEVVSPEGDRAEVTEAHSDPLPSPEVTESPIISGASPAGSDGANQDTDSIQP